VASCKDRQKGEEKHQRKEEGGKGFFENPEPNKKD
jgi:hypothetical protein